MHSGREVAQAVDHPSAAAVGKVGLVEVVEGYLAVVVDNGDTAARDDGERVARQEAVRFAVRAQDAEFARELCLSARAIAEAIEQGDT